MEKMNGELIYNRSITSGLGDRFGNYLSVAALARALDTNVHVFWANDAADSGRFYSLDIIRANVQLPKNIVMHNGYFQERTDSAIQCGKSNLEIEISYSGNELPATSAYDCVYTLSHRALSVPGHAVSTSAMEEAFRSVASEWDIRGQSCADTRRPYVALHLRGADKGLPLETMEENYCTSQILSALPRGVDVVAVTDDDDLLNHYIRRFPSLKGCPAIRDPRAKELADMRVLMRARAILQHSYAGWSAFLASSQWQSECLC